MKKTLFSIIVAGVAVLVSCSKGSSPIPPPPATPTLNIGLSPETVWYNEASTIIWSTANTDSVQVNGVKVNGNSLLTPLLTADTTYTFKAFGPGGSLTRTVTVFVCSQKTTLLSNYGNWKNVYSVSYKQTDALNPALYNHLYVDSFNCRTCHYTVAKFYFYLYIYWYTGQIYQGCGFPAVNENFQWDWAYNETQISYDVNPSFNWNVDTLNTSLLRISKDIPDPGSPNIILHYVRKYVHG